jgi:NADH-quinone oxidoreductase subunit C
MDVLALTQKFPQTQNLEGKDMPTFVVNSTELAEIVQYLRDEQGFDILADLCGMDWKDRSPRFGVVIHLLSTRHREYVRLHAPCVNDAVPTVSAIHPGANWHEREAYDMFGIKFTGHPDQRRILMWEAYPYHPLRKEFPLAGIEVPFPAADVAAVTGQTVEPAPMMGGPFVSSGGHMSGAEPQALDQSWNEEKPKS